MLLKKKINPIFFLEEFFFSNDSMQKNYVHKNIQKKVYIDNIIIIIKE